MKLHATLHGVNEMKEVLQALGAKFPDHVLAAMHQEAQLLVTEMKRRCPVDTGLLRSSIHAELPERVGKRLTQLFATGENVPYAIEVHENPNAYHRVGTWKFMENPLLEAVPDIARRIGARANFGTHDTAGEFLSARIEMGTEDDDDDED